MNSREDFLKILKVNNENNTKNKNRYTSNIKAKDIAKKPGLRKRVAAIFMAGVITGVSMTGCYNYFKDSEPQHDTNKTQITMMNHNQNILPEEIFSHNKVEYNILQKNIAEYKKLDNIFLKNDAQEKRFTELQNAIAEQNKLVENLYLNLVKHKVAKDHNLQRASDLRIKPGYDEGTPIHSVYNKADNTRIFYDQLGQPVLNAISDIANFQSKREQQGKTIPLKDTFKLDVFNNYEKYVVTDTPLVAEMVINLNDSMMEFGKVVKKDKEQKNSENKNFEEER